MILYLPNGGKISIHGIITVEYTATKYRVTTTKDKRLVLDIVDGIVIIYNSFEHRYTPPVVPLSPSEIVSAINLEKLNHDVICAVRNKLMTYRARSRKWIK